MNRIDIEFPGIQKAIITEVTAGFPVLKGLGNDMEGTSHSCVAIWDTGSTNTLITRTVVDQLNLKPIGKSEVFGITGTAMEYTYLISLRLSSQYLFESLRVIGCATLGRNVDVLIGMDIINKGDMALTHAKGKTRFYYQFPSLGTLQL